MKKELVQIENLRDFAGYILAKHLDDFVQEDLARAKLLDLPLIGLFSHLPEQDFFALLKKSAEEMLKELVEGNAIEGSYKLIENIKANKIEGIPKEKLNLRDVGLIYNIRKHSFFKFLPNYTDDFSLTLKIVTELEDFFTLRQNMVFQVYTEILTEILKEGEENFRSLANSSFEGIAIHNNTVILEVNQTLASLFGYNREEIIGKDIKLFTPESEHRVIIENITNNREYPYETIGLRKDGSTFPIEIMGRQILYKGLKARVAGVRDITERKKQELENQKYVQSLEQLNQQLKREKEFNQILLDNAYSMIIAFDRDMIITAWNKKLELTGLTREQALGKNYYDIFPEYKGNDDYLNQVWQGKPVIIKEKPFRKRNGYYDAEIIPLFNDRNEVVGALSYSRDVTERKLAEERLREQEHFIKQIANSSPSLIYVFDMETSRFVYSNYTLQKFIGLSENELLESAPEVFFSKIHKEDIPKLMDRLGQYGSADSSDHFYLEYRNRNAAGEWRWLANTTKVFKRNKEGKVSQILGIALDITDKKLIEEAFQEQAKTFQTILDSIPVLVFWMDKNHRNIGFNKAYQQFMNLPYDQLIGRSTMELFQDSEKYTNQDLRVMESGMPVLDIVESVQSPVGTKWIKIDKVPLKNSRDEIIGVIGSAIDISELKRTQEELFQLNAELEKRVAERTREVVKSEERYRFLADFVPQIFWTSDPSGNVDYYNKNWFEFTGLSFEESMGWGWKKIIHPEDFEITFSTWSECLKSGRPYQMESRYFCAGDKTYRWYLVRALPLKDENGNIIKWFGTSTDIHDHKIAEESLEMQALVLESMDEGVCVTDDQGYIIYTNSAEDRIFGYEPGELVGKHLSVQTNYPSGENTRKVSEVIAELKNKGVWNGEWKNLRKDGTSFTTFAHITTLHLDTKKLFVSVQRDITEEKRFRETILSQNKQLTKINNDLDNFIYTASHDLKAPVSNIEGLVVALSETLRDKEKVDPEIENILNLVNTSITRFQSTIKDLTEISKIQKNIYEEQEELDIPVIFEEVMHSLKKQIEENSAVVKTNFKLLKVRFSRVNFKSILYNLISNAIKYRSPERNPFISVKTFETEESFVLEVEDNGLGIREENIEKIFSMFKRLHSHVEGSGVGLYLVKRIVDNAGGTIDVKSDVDAGSLFRIFLPKAILL